eukprot:6183527-Pleurochrysis_carterae.AAC.1
MDDWINENWAKTAKKEGSRGRDGGTWEEEEREQEGQQRESEREEGGPAGGREGGRERGREGERGGRERERGGSSCQRVRWLRLCLQDIRDSIVEQHRQAPIIGVLANTQGHRRGF